MLTDAPFVCNRKKLWTTSILLVTILNGYGRRFFGDLNSIDYYNETCIKIWRTHTMLLKKRVSYIIGKCYFQMCYLVNMKREI